MPISITRGLVGMSVGVERVRRSEAAGRAVAGYPSGARTSTHEARSRLSLASSHEFINSQILDPTGTNRRVGECTQ